MYLRESKQRRSDGSIVTYLQLAENVWNAAKGRSQASIVHNCADLQKRSCTIPDLPELRELVIAFGDSGYVALYRNESADDAVYVLAFRHQKEAGYR